MRSHTNNNETVLGVLSGWCEGVATTNGEHGSMFSFNGEVMKITPNVVSTLDTTDAGDADKAGLLFGIINGRTIMESGLIANLFFAMVIAKIGPNFNGDIQ